ncbi:acyltransferase [Asticcacaulis sp. ZE23SCel15]|uniref:acyltransferase family protein n=1 Tax=Asticcacaulis sp. ZE23SCel15 TaxID=3059027 RepID=UPI00265D7587|nr:acyltransferase [Asticcacaulis sp. ZE23SCel15]WKL55957.1 acyltransferase [Asticcacaulis sp. ZE23SCel15]
MASSASGRFYELDILRGAASLLVVAYHYVHFYCTWEFNIEYLQRFPFFDLLKPIYFHGNSFVEMFFSISGYVFFWLYREGIAGGLVSFKDFLVARLARLYPLYIVTLIVVVGLVVLFRMQYGYDYVYQGNTKTNLLLSVLMVQQWIPGSLQSFNGPSWSISVEMALYGMFFLFCWLKLGRVWLWGPVIIGIILNSVWSTQEIWRGPPSFFLGAMAFYAVQDIKARAYAVNLRKLIGAFVIIGWVCAAIFGYELLPETPDYSFVSIVFSRESLIFFLMPLTLVATGLWEGAIIPEHLKPLSWLGDISYSTYLIHFPLQMTLVLFLNRLPVHQKIDMVSSPMFFLSFFAVLIGLSILSYAYFEMPTRLWLLKRFSPRIQPEPIPKSAL